MRIIFMGSPDFAVPSLNALVEAGHDVIAAYAQPPRPAGRGKADRKTAVQLRAEELGIEVRTPRTLRDADEQERFRELDADLAVVAAYGLILPKLILEAPKGGCFNVHASLLPRWRGAAPIQRAILAGDKVTGVTIIQMDEGLDTGPMLAKWETPLCIENAGMMTRRLSKLGAQLLVEVLTHPSDFPPVPQPEEGATYAPKVEKTEARILFTRTADEIERQVDAFNPYPGAFFEFKGERIKILVAEADEGSAAPGTVVDDELRIACGDGVLIPMKVQRAGRAPMTPGELLRGFPIPKGTILK